MEPHLTYRINWQIGRKKGKGIDKGMKHQK